MVWASALTIARGPLARTKARTGHARIYRRTMGGRCYQGSRPPGAAQGQSSRYGNPASTEPPQVRGTYCTDGWDVGLEGPAGAFIISSWYREEATHGIWGFVKAVWQGCVRWACCLALRYPFAQTWEASACLVPCEGPNPPVPCPGPPQSASEAQNPHRSEACTVAMGWERASRSQPALWQFLGSNEKRALA